MRWSNGGDKPNESDASAARGLAVKLILPPSLDNEPRYLDDVTVDPARIGAPDFKQDPHRKEQHFLMIGASSTFSFRDTTAAVLGESILAKTEAGGNIVGRALRLLNRDFVGVLNVVKSTFSGITAHHPFYAEYHSLAPFAFGPGRAVKFSLKPCEQSYPKFEADRKDPNYFSKRLYEFLKDSTKTACFNFFVQFQEDACEQPIENPGVIWNTKAHHLGVLRVGPQSDVDSKERLDECERRVFSPAFALQAHAPLGSINYARLRSYEISASHRLNGKQEFTDTPLPEKPAADAAADAAK